MDYNDPFNCECRAYGRLAQENQLDLSFPAQGWLLLTPQQEAEATPLITGGLEYEHDDEEPMGTLDRETWGRCEEDVEQPIRAIIKEFVEDDDFEEAFKRDRIFAATMWRDLEDLHSLGILRCDIYMGNYIGGKLVDLNRRGPCTARASTGCAFVIYHASECSTGMGSW